MNELKELINKRVQYVGYVSKSGKDRKVPLDFDRFCNVVLGGAIPNIARRFKDKNSAEEAIEVVLDYLMNTKEISSSHFPTLLRKSEAPNYQFGDYKLDSDTKTKKEILSWFLTFYYIHLWKNKRQIVLGIRTDDLKIKEIIEFHMLRGSNFNFELKTGKIEGAYMDKKVTYYLPSHISAAYFILLLLFSSILNNLRFEGKEANLGNSTFEILISSNNGGKKWSTVYHPISNLSKLYGMFFKELEFPKMKFIMFLESLNPPKLQNINVLDFYYSTLSDFAFSILVEGYLNVNIFSKIIGEKISLEFRAKRENKAYALRKIYHANHVQTKFFGGIDMDENFKKLKKRMFAIAKETGKLGKMGDTQKGLLKRIIMDLKNEEIPVYFVETLVSYLPRLEREGINITLPQELVTLSIREFLILKNEFIISLWNSYVGFNKKGGN